MRKSTILGVVVTIAAVSSVSLAAPRGARRAGGAARTAKSSAMASQKRAPITAKGAALTKAAPQVTLAKANITKTPSGASAATALAPATVPSIQPMRPIPGTGSSSTAIKEVVPMAKKSPWGLKYRSYNKMGLQGLQSYGGKDAEIQAQDRLTLSYQLNDNNSISVNPEFYHTWFGDRDRAQDADHGDDLEQKYVAYMRDTFLEYANSKVATLPGGVVFDLAARYYIPLSEVSQKSGSFGRIRLFPGLAKGVGNFEFKFYQDLNYFMQQYQTSSLGKRKNGVLIPDRNKNFAIGNLIATTWTPTKKFTFYVEAGPYGYSTHGDDNNHVPSSYLQTFWFNPEVSYKFTDFFSLAVGLAEEVPMAKMTEYVAFDPENDGEAYIQTTFKF